MPGTRGIFFTVDAIFAAALLLLVLLLLPGFGGGEVPLIQTSYEASDGINLMAELKVSELTSAYVTSLIASGIITNANNSVLEQVGEFWAKGNITLAQNLTREVLNDLISQYEVVIGDENLTGTTVGARQVIGSRRMVSGIVKGQSKVGFSSRAYATKAKKNNTLIVTGDIVVSAVKKIPSGNNGNELNTTYTFEIPSDATITDAYWFIEAAWTDNKFKAYLNGNLIPGSDATGEKLMTGLASYIHTGNNTASVLSRYGSSGAEAGEDGASHVVVTYNTESPSTLKNLNKKYFAETNSLNTIRYKKPIFTLGNVQSINVELDAVGSNATLGIIIQGTQVNVSRKNITSTGHVSWSSSEILTNLTNMGYTFANLTGQYFWVAIDIGIYKAPETSGTLRKINKTSYVNLVTDQSDIIYGKLDLTQILPVTSYSTAQSGSFYRNLNWSYNVSSGMTPLMIDSQLAWLYSSGSDPSQNATSNAVSLYKHPSQPLIKEFARMGFSQSKGAIVNGTNHYRLRFGSGYGINPFNSLVFSTHLVDMIVPYGNPFNTQANSTADAIQRLKDQLGPFINASDISTDTTSLANVPSLWGPTIVELRAWR